MEQIQLSNNSKIELHTLLFREEDGKHVVGREEIQKYIEIPSVGVQVIKLLRRNHTIKEIKEVVDVQEKDDVNVRKFIHKLISVGFVKKVDGKTLPEYHRRSKDFLSFVKPAYARIIFSKSGFFVLTFLFLIAVTLILKNPNYLPSFRDYFFHQYFSVVIVTSVILGWILVFFHEVMHLLAAKSLGVGGTIRLNNRLSYLVAESDVTNLWKVQRKKRWVVYMAGIFFELVFISLAIIALALSDYGAIVLPILLYKIIKMLIFIEVIGIVWEFRIYIRTDIYYVLSNILNQRNLYKGSLNYFKQKIKSLFVKSDSDIDKISSKQKSSYMIFFTILIIGSLFTVGSYIFFIIPVLMRMFKGIFIQISQAVQFTDPRFIDGMVTLAINLLYVSLLIYFIIKKIKSKRALLRKQPNVVMVES